jgi:hypothetical protein
MAHEIYSTQSFSFMQIQLELVERGIVKKKGLAKNWVTILSNSLPATERFRIQRKGCEPATIEVSYDYMLYCQSRKLIELERRVTEFNRLFAEAIRSAIIMATHNAFITPQEAKKLADETKRVKLAELRATKGILPPENFTVKYIAVITENVSGEQRRIGIPQTTELPTLYDMVREGKRKLTEQLLADHELAMLAKLQVETPDPVPTKVVISASNGEVTTSTSYQELET